MLVAVVSCFEVCPAAFAPVPLALAATFLVVTHAGVPEANDPLLATGARLHHELLSALCLFLGRVAFQVADEVAHLIGSVMMVVGKSG